MTESLQQNLPFITPDLPGVGGEIKSEPEHFQVEEIPLYEPEGRGEHLFIRLRREGWNTHDLAVKLSEILGLKEVDVGYAGLKDKRARVIQTFSLFLPPVSGEESDVSRACRELGVDLLWTKRHPKKLRTGHLLGNNFRLVLTGVDKGAVAPAQDIASALMARGLANFYGVQRFGLEGDNASRGRQVLEGRGPRQRWLRRFLLSAYQARLFNNWLIQRFDRGWFDRLLSGDLAKKTDTGGLFQVEDEDLEQPRFVSGAITYTGPIYGYKMRRPGGLPAELEQEVLDRHEVTEQMFRKAGLEGSRRTARLRLSALEVKPHPKGLELNFALPKGAYATTVLREFTKSDFGELVERSVESLSQTEPGSAEE